jgi:hypothetical protein
VKKTRERTAAGANAMSLQLCSSFFQGQVRLARNHRHHTFRLRFQWRKLPPRGFGAALLISFQRCIHLTTGLTLTPKWSGRLMPGRACLNHLDNAFT